MRLLSALLLLACAAASSPTRAADSYDGCKHEITSLPVTLTTQGVWCMKSDLTTAITSGAAITIAANNVTLDCNQSKVGGLQAGPETTTAGVLVFQRNSATIRNCNLRGFRFGVYVVGSSGTLVEDSLFESNTTAGINSDSNSYGTIVRRNRIGDTGGSSTVSTVAGIIGYNDVHVIDNFISGVAGDAAGNTDAAGIYIGYGTGTVTGNRIAGLVPDGIGMTMGVYSLFGEGHVVDGNFINGGGVASSTGVYCDSSLAVARNNVLMHLTTGVYLCEETGNYVEPN